ncbi:MAG: hypothetical protein [Caudoviricetes sp.]|nr:MAG: hypothetical protein [Caudoviricetes sp.]
MAEKKTTKVEWFEILKGIVNESAHEKKEELIEFIDKQIEATIKRNTRQAQYKSKKAKEPDGLYDAVNNLLTDEFQTVDDILNQVDRTCFPNVTKNKVVSRLKKIVDEGRAEKKEKSVEGSRLMHYKRIADAVVE